MKRVLLVAPYGGVPGGISRWTSHIVEYYNGLLVHDIILDLVPMGRSMFVNINMPTWKRLWSAWIDYRKIFADFKRKVKSGYEVMHLTSSGGLSLYKDLYMLRRAKKCGSKSIIHFRFGRIPELANQNNWEWKMVKKAVSMADRVVVIDRLTYDTLVGCSFKNIILLPNPVAPAVEKIISENPNIIRQKREILFTGHIVKTKGVFELLRACSTLNDVHLTMVGHITPDMHHEIECIYGKPEWLTISGEKTYEEVIKDMMRCDVFVLPTYTEGFPNVILESMATGCAIVTTPVGAIPQMLEEENGKLYGVFVKPKDSISLSTAISSLLNDEKLKSELRKNVKKRVIERYNIQSVWNRLVDIWEIC